METPKQTKVKAIKAPKVVKVSVDPKVKEPKAKKVSTKVAAPATVAIKVDDSLTFVATSRIKTYINDTKLNKDVNQILSIIKNAREFKTDLNQLLSAEQQEVVGKFRVNAMKQEQKRVEEAAKTGNEVDTKDNVSSMDPYTIAEKAFTRSKMKFSKDSFQVVGIVVDKILYELVVSTMDNMLQNVKVNSISVKHISVDKTSPLYAIYNNSKTFKSLEALDVTAVEASAEDQTDTEDSSEESSSDKKVNFKCYIRKIIDKVKSTDEKYAVFNNSTPFKQFCSDLVLDILDRVCNILETISVNLHFKTINKELFITIFKIMICDQNGVRVCDKQLFVDVEQLLSQLSNQRDELNAKRKAEKVSA